MDRSLARLAFAALLWLAPFSAYAACTGTFPALTTCVGPSSGSGQGNPVALTNAYLPIIGIDKGGNGAALVDPNADRLMAFDDSLGTVHPMALADILTEASPAAGDFIVAYTAEGALVKIDWDDLPSGGGGGATDFTDLGDVPSSYTGEGEKWLRVNDGENAIEFADIEWGALVNVDGDFSGHAGEFVVVNTGEDGLEFSVVSFDGLSDKPTTLSGYGITDAQPLDPDLTAVADLSGSGLVARTGSATYAERTLTAPAAGITVSNGNGVAGNPTLGLGDDLAALEAQSGTGIVTRTATDTYAQRSVVGVTNQTAVSNGSGVSGNPTVGLANDVIVPDSLTVNSPDESLSANFSGGQGAYVVVGPYYATLGGDDAAQFNITNDQATGIALFRFGSAGSETGAVGEFGAGGSDAGTWDSIVFYNTKGAFDQVWQVDGDEAFRVRATDRMLLLDVDDAYDATDWNDDLTVPTKNAVRDAVENLASVYQPISSVLTTLAGASSNGQSLVTAANYAAMRALLDLEPGTDFLSPSAIAAAYQPIDTDLSDISGLTATTNNILQSVSSAWASRTPAQVTATLPAFVGDSGSGGTKGLVPAPASGDAAAGRFLKADGTWAVPPGAGGGASAFTDLSDVPSSYIGHGGEAVVVNGTEDGLEFVPASGSDDQTAAEVPFTPAGGVAADDVQAAIEEVDTEKLALAGGTMTGNIAFSGSQTVDGRDLSADGSKLDGIESGADVTDAGNVGAVNAAASSKGTPVNADSFVIVDSEASDVIKRVTGTNLKAFLKTYFDGVYQPLSSALTSLSSASANGVSWVTAADYTAMAALIESAMESALDTLPNVTNVQGRAVTLADAGTDAFFGWDDSADAYENLTPAEGLAIILGVDGSGSGLDADTVDGQHATAFLAATAAAGGDLAGNYPNPTIAADAIGLDELDLITGNTPSDGECALARPAGSGGTIEFDTCPGGGGGEVVHFIDRDALAAAAVDGDVDRVYVEFYDDADQNDGGAAPMRRLGPVGGSGDLAGRDAYDAEPAGFIYLQTDVSPDAVWLKVPVEGDAFWINDPLIDGLEVTVSNSASVVWVIDTPSPYASMFGATQVTVLDTPELSAKPDSTAAFEAGLHYLSVFYRSGQLYYDRPYAINLTIENGGYGLSAVIGNSNGFSPWLTAYDPDDPVVLVGEGEDGTIKHFTTQALTLLATYIDAEPLSKYGLKLVDVANSNFVNLRVADFATTGVWLTAAEEGTYANTFVNPTIRNGGTGGGDSIGLLIEPGTGYVTNTTLVGGDIYNNEGTPGDWAAKFDGTFSGVWLAGALIHGPADAVLNLVNGGAINGTGTIEAYGSGDAVTIDGTDSSVPPYARIHGNIALNGDVTTGLGTVSGGLVGTAIGDVRLGSLVELSSPAANDLLLIEDVDEGDFNINRKKVTVGALVGGKQTIPVMAGAMKNDATSPASCGDTYDSGSNDVTLVVCAFDTGATEERADFLIPLPKSYDGGTFTYQAIWTNTGGSSTQTVQWEVACVFFRDDDALNATLGSSVTVSDTWLAANDNHVSAESSALTCGGTYATGATAFFRVSRDTSNDNMSGDALLIALRLHYTSNAANDS